MTPWLVLSPLPPHHCDGIGDYAWHLTRALTRRTIASELLVKTSSAPSLPDFHALSSWRVLRDSEWRDRARTAAGVIVHYMPQAFAHADFPALLGWLGRFDDPARPVILTLHELWVPTNGRLRRAAVHAIHLRMLAMLSRRAGRIVVTTRRGGEMLDDAGLSKGRQVRVIPVGSNIERVDTVPAADPTLVLFGQPASFHGPTIQAVGRWLAESPRPVRLLWIGGDPVESRRMWTTTLELRPDRVEFFSGLTPAAVSALVGSAHIALGPYVDGVSTRRSSLATLLAHHLPVVGLDGACTEALQRNSAAFVLNSPDTPADFVANIEMLLDNPDRRRQMAEAAAHITDTVLSWDRIAAQYAELAQP